MTGAARRGEMLVDDEAERAIRTWTSPAESPGFSDATEHQVRRFLVPHRAWIQQQRDGSARARRRDASLLAAVQERASQ
ncbi:MAG: hypothetical protein E5Y69_07025 [Mesorhizobium sp.]|nr:MAG: hypothetical protein E5Y69_07025 [Mesorhizobium sp.]